MSNPGQPTVSAGSTGDAVQWSRASQPGTGTNGGCLLMPRIRLILLSLLVMFATSGVVATAAQAAEGLLFWKVNGKSFAKGETREITKVKASKNYVLKGTTATVTCTKNEVSEPAVLTGGSPGGDTEVVIFKGCTVSGNGTGCKVETEEVKTEPVESELLFETISFTGKILELFRPASGTLLASVKFTGTCVVTEAGVSGSVIGEVWSGGKAVVVGKEPAETVTGEINFPKTQIKAGFIEEMGIIVEKKAKLSFGVGEASLEGRSEIEVGGRKWGAYT